MFTSGNKSFGLFFFILFFISLTAFSQSGNLSAPELKVEAEKLFDSEKFDEAYEIFNSLLERYPRDGEFNYYTGICLYKMNRDLPTAIDYLDYASSKTQVPTDVYYYLGMAYRKNYQFRKAQDAFREHNEMAGRSEVRELDPDHEARNSGNAMELTMEYNPFEILASSLFTFADSNYVKQVRGKGGTLKPKPLEFYSKDENPGDLTSYMFIPKNPSRGDYVFMAGYPRSKKNGSELYRIRKNGGKTWGDPSAIDVLNSEYDEILPYFDPVGNDLYFASRGHNSMGGFDVFKSHYDPDRDEWSEAVNLGFPVNSPEDEFLAMPGSDLGTILLITNRQGLDSMLTVYKLILQEPKETLAGADNEELRRIGNLGGISAIPEIVDLSAEAEAPSKKEISDAASQEVKEEKNQIQGQGSTEQNIIKALALQKRSDSLVILAKESRVKVRSMPDPNDRWSWQRQIIEWEKQASDFGEQAAVLFALVEEEKKKEGVAENQRKNIPSSIEVDKEINGITVYRYTGAESAMNSETEAPNSEIAASSGREDQAFRPEDEPGDVVPPPTEIDPGMNRIVILAESPYKASNPFPKDVEIPSGSFYRIQLGVFSQEVEFNTFKGISPITSESIPGKDLTRYYAGKFTQYESAREALEKVKNEGFKDAFIVSWYNGQKTSLNKVIELEKRDRP